MNFAVRIDKGLLPKGKDGVEIKYGVNISPDAFYPDGEHIPLSRAERILETIVGNDSEMEDLSDIDDPVEVADYQPPPKVLESSEEDDSGDEDPIPQPSEPSRGRKRHCGENEEAESSATCRRRRQTEQDLIDAVVTAAEVSADNLIRSEGRDIHLEESLDLHLPFLLPQGGYSCDTVRGIPLGLREFLEPICRKGLCSLTSQPNSEGDSTVYFSEPTAPAPSTCLAAHREPDIVTITLNKPLNSGMGRQAVSQENLCVDSGGPLLDTRQHFWEAKEQRAKQTMSHDSSFPIRSSISADDILSDYCSPAKQQQGGRTSGTGVWRTPFSQHPTPTPSNQPTRIDIPVTRAMNAHTSPPLTTFQSSSLSQPVKAHVGINRADHVYACPITATRRPPQPAPPSQQQRRNTHSDPAAKPHVSITPTKHVSFQEPLAEQKQCAGHAHPKEPVDRCDPWRRDAQEKLEKQQRLQVVELLEQEVQELQGKARRTAEENGRLRRISLEWQFQKRLQELQQRGEDEEEDEDLDMMVIIQQLENRAQNNGSSSGNNELEESEKPVETKAKLDERQSGRSQDSNNIPSNKNSEEKTRRVAAPEKLTFKQRQRLFSPASSA